MLAKALKTEFTNYAAAATSTVAVLLNTYAVSETDRKVLRAILEMYSPRQSGVCVSSSLFVRKTGFDYRTVARSLERLHRWGIIDRRLLPTRCRGKRARINAYQIRPPEYWRMPRKRRLRAATILMVPEHKRLSARLLVAFRAIGAGEYEDSVTCIGRDRREYITVGELSEVLRKVSGTTVSAPRMGLLCQRLGLRTRTITGGYKALSIQDIKNFVSARGERPARVESRFETAGTKDKEKTLTTKKEGKMDKGNPVDETFTPCRVVRLADWKPKPPVNDQNSRQLENAKRELRDLKRGMQLLDPGGYPYQVVLRAVADAELRVAKESAGLCKT